MTSISYLAADALASGGGILRLAPTWVPRSFLQPGLRLKLHPADYYSLGVERGGIDERWFSSTTAAANEGASHDEGLSYCIYGNHQFTLCDAISELGAEMIGQTIWNEFGRWPVYSKFFDNMGPIPHHLHQSTEQAKLVGQEGKPESYYFPPQLNAIGNHFPYTFFGLEPGTTQQDVIDCLARWNEGDNGILDLSRAYRLSPGTGYLVPPRLLHAPGSLVTYEPQWGSDVFAIYQSMVEGRAVTRSLLTKDFPTKYHDDLKYLVAALDWDANVNPNFKNEHYLEPIPVADTASEGFVDRWVVYGKIDGRQQFSAKELTVDSGRCCTITDSGAYGWITVQGYGRIGKLPLETPAMIRYGQMTHDEVFVAATAASEGVVVENMGSEPLVSLRYFGPDANPEAPLAGDHRKRSFSNQV